MYVYLLYSSSKKTYIGATVDVQKRLRKHNKIVKGGARYTGKWVDRGDKWECICYVSGFPTWIDALQFEWKWKKLSHGSSLQKRLEALNVLITSNRSTSLSTPFALWDLPLTIHDVEKNKSTTI
jgi:predicted GIY-YIG superfamily endonuclease